MKEDCKMRRLIKLLAALVPIANNLLYADGVVADRPGFSTGTYSVPPGRYNIEMGYSYTFDSTTSENDSQSFPLFELRTGVTENMEFDILWDGWSMSRDFENGSVADITIGGKYRLVKNDLYNITMMALATLPTGDESDFELQGISPLVGLLWDYTANEYISYFGTLQTSTYKEQKRIYDFQTAIGLSIAHTEKIGSFLEIYTILPSSGLSKEYVIDGGFTYMLRKNIQLDINGGVGLNEESNSFVGFGIAIGF